MKKLLLLAICATPLWPAACTLNVASVALSASAGHWTGSGCTGGSFIPGNGDTVSIPNGDKLTVNQNWTIGASGASNTTAAIETNNSGLVEVAAGATLRARGDVHTNNSNYSQANMLILDAGSSFVFDASQASSPTTTRYRIGGDLSATFRGVASNGTSASHVTVTSDLTNGALPGQFRFGVVGAASSGFGGIVFSATYTDFSYVGDATTYGEAFSWGGYNCSGSCSPTLGILYILRHDTFDHCGPNVSSGKAYGGISGDASILIDSNVFTNSLGGVNFSLDAETPAGANYRTVSNNVLDLKWDGRSAGLQSGVAFTGNYFGDGTSALNSSGVTFADNFMHRLAYEFNDIVYFANAVTGTYFFYDFSPQDNPHVMSTGISGGVGVGGANITNSGIIFEEVEDYTADSGEVLYADNPCSPNCTVVYKNSILLPTRTGASSAELSSGTYTEPDLTIALSYLHNTWVGSNPFFGMLDTNENGAQPGPFSAMESNLAWANSGGYLKTSVMGNNVSANLLLDSVTTADYNGADSHLVLTDPSCTNCTNQGRGYAGKWSATPGAHDVTANPYFADYLRNTPLWDTKYLGHTAAQGAWVTSHGYSVGDVVGDSHAGYYNNQTVNFRCTVAHTSGSTTEPNVGASWHTDWEFASNYDLRMATAAGTTYTDGAIGCAGCTAIQALMKWVRRGHVPQNPALWCAGHDGETIGAVPFCAAGKALIGAMAGM